MRNRIPEIGRYGMARPFSPASDMMLVSEEELVAERAGAPTGDHSLVNMTDGR